MSDRYNLVVSFSTLEDVFNSIDVKYLVKTSSEHNSNKKKEGEEAPGSSPSCKN